MQLVIRTVSPLQLKFTKNNNAPKNNDEPDTI